MYQIYFGFCLNSESFEDIDTIQGRTYKTCNLENKIMKYRFIDGVRWEGIKMKSCSVTKGERLNRVSKEPRPRLEHTMSLIFIVIGFKPRVCDVLDGEAQSFRWPTILSRYFPFGVESHVFSQERSIPRKRNDRSGSMRNETTIPNYQVTIGYQFLPRNYRRSTDRLNWRKTREKMGTRGEIRRSFETLTNGLRLADSWKENNPRQMHPSVPLSSL